MRTLGVLLLIFLIATWYLVLRIEEEAVGRLCKCNTSVSGYRETRVRAMIEQDCGFAPKFGARNPCPSDSERVIFASVIHYNHAKIVSGLRENAVQGLPDIIAVII